MPTGPDRQYKGVKVTYARHLVLVGPMVKPKTLRVKKKKKKQQKCIAK